MTSLKLEAPPGNGGASRIISQRAAANINNSKCSSLSGSRQGQRHIDETTYKGFVDHLHRLGPDILAGFLTEITDPIDLEVELCRYVRLDSADPCIVG